MPTGRLILHPEDAFARLPETELIRSLQEWQLMGEDFPGRPGLAAGERFLQWISFMGCSPYLVFEPPANDSGDFCHLRLITRDIPRLLTGANTAPPRCPACRQRLGDWRNAAANWRLAEADYRWDCPACGVPLHPAGLVWRQQGGVASQWLEIHGIFPGEGVPVDLLMRNLGELGAGPWTYFYLRD